MSFVKDKCYFSCLNYNNVERKIVMENRFKYLNINCDMYSGVSLDNERIKHIDNNHKRLFSCTYGHLDMIYKFFHETNKEYGIFCEDDIYIHNALNSTLEYIIKDVTTMNLDILLLGYLIPYKIENTQNGLFININNTFQCESYRYYNYHNELWGAQMYLLTRKYAKYLLDTFYTDYAEKTLIDTTLTHFSPDWIITKNGNRALIYPMLAVEDGKNKCGQYWQDKFHTDCHIANFNENYI